MFALLAQEASKSAGGLTMLLPLVLMVGVMYFLLIRPQQKRQRAQREMIHQLEVGEEVITIGGIYGTIRNIDEDSGDVILEVAPGTTLRMLRNAIARPVTDDADDADEDDEDTDAVDEADGSETSETE